MSSRTGCFNGSVRVFSRSDRSLENDDIFKRRRVQAKTQLVKRLRISLSDWQARRARMERRTTARESTIALIRKARSSKCETSDNNNSSSAAVDPITRERIPRNSTEVFTFERGNSIARVDAGALIDYILATGDYSDPESRLPFKEDALRRLDDIGRRLGKGSVLEAKHELKTKFSDRQFLRDALCGLERICGASVTLMFELVEKVNEDEMELDDAQIQLLTNVLPEFESHFEQLCQADQTYAHQSAKQFESFLRGPPNKPVKSTAIHKIVMESFTDTVKDCLQDR